MLGVGLAPAEVAARLRASVGLSDRAGLLVRTVAADSAADDAGIHVGDLLTAAGGSDLTSVDDLHAALDAARATGELALHLVRGSDDLDLTVTFPDVDTGEAPAPG